MFPALIITIFVLVIVGFSVYIYIENKLYKARTENKFLNFEKKVFFNLGSGLDDSQNFESAVNILVSTISEYFSFTSCSYVVKTAKELKFKAYLSTPVNLSYIKVVERKSLELFVKKCKIPRIHDMAITENISGFGLNNDVEVHPKSFVFVPIKFKENCIGMFALASSDSDYCVGDTCLRLKRSLVTIFNFIFELQEIGKTGTAKEEYMNMIIHDLRTPLTIIQGSSDMLIKRKKDLSDDMKDELILDTKSAAKRLLNIVDNLLDIARLENGKFKVDLKDIDMIEFLTGVLKQYKLFVEERGLKFIVTFPKSTKIVCKIDTHIIERVMDNLISNAVKYTKTGSVTVNIEHAENKNKLKVAVIDTGVGISKDKQNLLFNKFEQIVNPVDSTSKSTGLGLVVAKKLIEENNGKMDFTSTENVGSIFYFVLPIVK